jgi:hypothetical protein
MKRVKIDIIYVLGLLITLTGFWFMYVNEQSYLTKDFLYPLQRALTPLVVNIFILGGMSTIIIEFLLAKDYHIFLSQQKEYLYYIFGSILVFILALISPMQLGLSIIFFMIFGTINYVFYKTKRFEYIIILILLIISYVERIIPSELLNSIAYVLATFVISMIVYGLYLIGKCLYLLYQKKNNKGHLYLTIDYVSYILLGAFIGYQELFIYSWFLLLVYSNYLIFRISNAQQLNLETEEIKNTVIESIEENED